MISYIPLMTGIEKKKFILYYIYNKNITFVSIFVQIFLLKYIRCKKL